VKQQHVVIVGGGVIGLSCAYYCAQAGLQVTVVDRNPESRDGCSFGNAGMIVPSHFVPLAAPGMVALGLKWMWNPESPFYIRPRLDASLLAWAYRFWRASTPAHVQASAPLIRDLSLASRSAFEELADLPGNDFGLVRKGLLMLCRTPHGLEEEAKGAEQARRLGIPADVLDPAGAAALEPGVRMDIAGAVHYPLDCHLSPDRFMGGLKRELDRLGTRFLWSTEVLDWKSSGHRIEQVVTSNGEVSGDEFLLCGGSWSPSTAAKLDLRLPIQAGKGYSLTLPSPRRLPTLCSIFTEARVAVTPMGSSLRFGGTMELSGLDERIDPVRVRGIIKAVSRYYPEFGPSDFEGIQPWRGLRPCSPDGLPYIGRTRSRANLTLATGHAMMGLSLAPVTGKIVAGILTDRPTAFDLRLLAPDRHS
jgi:D-amino-acid dehydrogenase